MTAMVFGYLIVISIDSYEFSFILISIEKIYQTPKKVLYHISEHFEIRQKCSATRRIFNSLPDVWKCGQTRSFVSNILLYFDSTLPFGFTSYSVS